MLDATLADLRAMLLDIALGRYVEYGGRGEYRYPVEQRLAATAALFQDHHAQRANDLRTAEIDLRLKERRSGGREL